MIEKGTKTTSLPLWSYKAMLVVATLIWGLSFVVMKDALGVLSPGYLLGFRFTATALILLAVFFRRVKANFNKDHIVKGCMFGVLIYLGYWGQTVGLEFTTPGKNAFLTSAYCVIVPFVCWVMMRKAPTKYNIIAALLCIFGVGLVSLQESLSIGFGDIMTLVGAALFAVQMVYVAKNAPGRDMLALTVWQFIAAGLCGLFCGFVFETPPAIAPLLEPQFLMDMGYLVLAGSCLALVLQNVALSKVPPSQSSLFLSLESVFGVAFSVALYGEVLTLRLLAGFALIFFAIVVSETFPLKGEAWRKKEKTTQYSSECQVPENRP